MRTRPGQRCSWVIEPSNCLGVQRPEAFIDEQAIERNRYRCSLYLLAQLQRQCERGEKGPTTAQGIGTPELTGVVVVDDEESVVASIEGINLGQVPQPLRCTMH
jgi:hypothetical protein